MRISKFPVGERLDKFITQKLPDRSRSQIQKIIERGGVLVNDRVVAKHYFLREGDVITIDVAKSSKEKAFKLKKNRKIPVEIIYECDSYAVENKPAGLIIHPGDTHMENDTLVNGLLVEYPEIRKVGDNPMRPGIVHRLDKVVSGVMVVARTQEMYEHLKKQFQARTVFKHYTALVHGVLTQDHGSITFDIMRSQRQRTKMAAVPPGQGKPARTDYDLVQQFQQYALVDAYLHTGRTHQIRVHMNAIGHPIVGDNVYVPKQFHSRLQPGRIFLHSTELKFNDIDGKQVEYISSLSSDLQAILDDLYGTT